MPIFIRAERVEDAGAGVFIITLPETELRPDQRETLEELFPNLAERVYRLLDQEALLSSLMTEEEANHHMSRGADPMPVKKLPRAGKISGKPHPQPPKMPTTDGDAMGDDDRVHTDSEIPY